MPGPDRQSAAEAAGPASAQELAGEALAMMVEALRLIDLSGGGATVAGAHLDLAIHLLRDWVDQAEPK